jgi:hypothetical protein
MKTLNSSARLDANLPVVTAALAKNGTNTSPGFRKTSTLGLMRSCSTRDRLGLAKPLVLTSRNRARCAVYHSPFQSIVQTRLVSAARPDEGVSCESCHGAAEPWLRGHTRPDWTYSDARLADSDWEFRVNTESRENQFYRALRLGLAIERLIATRGIAESNISAPCARKL